jgi:hypothetical protein
MRSSLFLSFLSLPSTLPCSIPFSASRSLALRKRDQRFAAADEGFDDHPLISLDVMRSFAGTGVSKDSLAASQQVSQQVRREGEERKKAQGRKGKGGGEPAGVEGKGGRKGGREDARHSTCSSTHMRPPSLWMLLVQGGLISFKRFRLDVLPLDFATDQVRENGLRVRGQA